MKNITKIDPAWADKYPAIVEKWTKIGLCTDPADRRRAEAGVIACYKAAGLAPPKRITWVESPMVMALSGPISLALSNSMSANVHDNVQTNVHDNVLANVHDNVWDNVKTNVWANVETNVHDNVWDNVETNVHDNVKANVKTNVWANVSANVLANVSANVETNVHDNVKANVKTNVWANVSANVRSNVLTNVHDNVWDNVKANVWNNWQKYRGGCWWASWHAYIDAMRTVVGVDATLLAPELNEAEIAQSAAWWYPTTEFCIICDRPSFIGINADNQLHCDTGPAIVFRDGWAIWTINGVRLGKDGEKIIMRPHEQTVAEIDAETNEEVRRIRIDRFGWPRYLKESGALVLDSRRNDIDNTMEILCRDNRGAVKLLCSCRSTGRVYAIGVSRDMATCHAAQKWMRGGSRFASRGHVIGAS